MRGKPRHATVWGVVLFVAVLTAANGCNKPDPPPAAYVGPTLVSADLGLEPVECKPTGFVILEAQASHGRFPAALTVAQLAPGDGAPSAAASPIDWQLGTIKEEKATYWNSLFNRVFDVREVTILDESSVQEPQTDLAEITAAARRAKANLCLIWGPRPAEPQHAALMGVITDLEEDRPIALVQADAGPDDFKEPATDHFDEDRRHEDVNYLVARKFQQQIKNCMYELITRDQKVPTTLPSPWRSLTTMPAEPRPVPVYVVPNRPTDTW